MPDFSLVRATAENKLLIRLRTSWERQVDDVAKGWLDNQLDHALKIAADDPADPRYGIYVLCDGDGDGRPRAPYEAFVHVNHAWPKSAKDSTVRLVWGAVAPKYMAQTLANVDRAKVLSSVIYSALALAAGEMPSKHVKIYLGGAVDKSFAHLFCSLLNPMVIDRMHARVRGTWLHLERN
ncbi:MAG: hypothetical protein GEU92_18245 [Alphaproteobacteria bacterium]|nr:hypothetical protein [Alphaproteobacteria bacterium]